MKRTEDNWKGIEEMNKKFAQFLGYEYIPFNENKKEQIVGWVKILDSTSTFVPEKLTKTGITAKWLCRTHRELQFHTDWNWIMAVVEKINEVSDTFQIHGKSSRNATVFGKELPYTHGDTLKDAVVLAAVKFINEFEKINGTVVPI